MSGTFSQIYIQIVFAVKGRGNFLQDPWRNEVFKYISGIVNGKNQKSIIVNGVKNHVHVFVGLKPSMSVSDLVRDIKTTPPILLTKKNGLTGNSHGKKDLVHFPIHIHK